MSAYCLFQFFSLGCMILFLVLRFRDYPDVVLLALMFPPLWANFLNGQDVGLLLAFSSISLWLSARGREVAAGLVLSLCAIKLHLFLAVPMAIIFHDRWRMILGGLAGGAILFAASLYSGGADFIVKLLAAVQVFNPQPDVMPNMRILYYPFVGDSSPAMAAAAILISALTCYLAWKAPDYETAFGYCLLGGLMMGVHGYMQDCLLILLAATLVIPRETSKAVKILLGIAVTPLPYFFLQNGSPYSFVFGCLQLSILLAGARHYYMASRRETPRPLAAAQG
jgi:hypothetical protein